METDWKSAMRARVDTFPILEHPYFQRVTAGEISPADLSGWALQDRHVSYMFPQLIALIVAGFAAPHRAAVQGRLALVRNLWEEMGEGEYSTCHSTLMDDMLLSLGVAPDKLLVEPLPATRRFIDLQLELAHDSPFAGLGAFCYANEYLVLREYPPMQAAVEQQFPGADIRFFLANWEVDGHHTELVEEAIGSLAVTEEDYGEVESGAEQALQARVAFYDDLYERLLSPSVASSQP